MTDLSQLRAEALAKITATAQLAELEDVRIHYLGKKGVLTEAMKALGAMDIDERKRFGAEVNTAKEALTTALDTRKAVLEDLAMEARLASEAIDVTLPARPEWRGRVHPVSKVIQEVCAIFAHMGFEVMEGPEVEDDYHNFTALNFPVGHAARDMHDTFYLPQGDSPNPILLRTHTSTVQIRTMQNGKPPFRFVAPGKTYRRDSDMTHTPMFHQIEGVLIDRNISMAHLKGCLAQFAREFFELDEVPVRFRASFFPFTEPSAEMDIGCDRSGGVVKIGAGTDWLEILGCGMVHPNVLTNCGLNPDTWQGFAFGMGVERLAMLKYGMPDLRAFFDSDPRWLGHYGFRPTEY